MLFRKYLTHNLVVEYSSLCVVSFTVAGKATYRILLHVGVYTSSFVKLISSMGLSYRCGLVQECVSVSVLQSCLLSRKMSLIVAVSCFSILFVLYFCLIFDFCVCRLPWVLCVDEAVCWYRMKNCRAKNTDQRKRQQCQCWPCLHYWSTAYCPHNWES